MRLISLSKNKKQHFKNETKIALILLYIDLHYSPMIIYCHSMFITSINMQIYIHHIAAILIYLFKISFNSSYIFPNPPIAINFHNVYIFFGLHNPFFLFSSILLFFFLFKNKINGKKSTNKKSKN